MKYWSLLLSLITLCLVQPSLDRSLNDSLVSSELFLGKGGHVQTPVAPSLGWEPPRALADLIGSDLGVDFSQSWRTLWQTSSLNFDTHQRLYSRISNPTWPRYPPAFLV